MTDDSRRIAVLDGLRALAIVLVLLRHSVHFIWPDISKGFPPVLAPLFNGWIGVDLFFVLSGFLITHQLLKIQHPNGYAGPALRGYFIRRFMRIAPAYYVALTIICLGFFPGLPHVSPDTVWGWRYISHLLFLQDYQPSDICVVFWSLAIEIKFYLVAPLLIALLMKIERSAIRYISVAGLIMLMIILRYITAEARPSTDYMSFFLTIRNQFHLSLDGLLAGMLCAMVWNDPAARAWIERKNVANSLFLGGLAVILALALPAPILQPVITLFDKTVLFALLAAAFGGMTLGLLGGSFAQNIFSARPLAYISRISYSLYLLHLPALFLVLSTIGAINPKIPPVLAWLLSLPLYLALSVGLAHLSYRFIEKPAIDWAKDK